MRTEDILRFASEVARGVESMDLGFRAPRPILVLGFADAGDYWNARMKLMQTITPAMILMGSGSVDREPASNSWEFDINGVTIRLLCERSGVNRESYTFVTGLKGPI